MPNFDKYSNYNENTGFQSVVFGAEAPVLEVELNEMQQIFNNKLGNFLKSFGNVVFFLDEADRGGFSIGTSTFTLKNCVAVCKGNPIYIKEASFNAGSSYPFNVYLRVENEVVVDYTTQLKAYGSVYGTSITNPIKDSRFPMETSRRKLIKFTFVKGDTKPADTDTYTYIPVCEIKAGDYGAIIHDWKTCRPVTNLDLANYQTISLAEATVEPKGGETDV